MTKNSCPKCKKSKNVFEILVSKPFPWNPSEKGRVWSYWRINGLEIVYVIPNVLVYEPQEPWFITPFMCVWKEKSVRSKQPFISAVVWRYIFNNSKHYRANRWNPIPNSNERFPTAANLPSGAPNVNLWKISVRKTIWDLEFSEHFL